MNAVKNLLLPILLGFALVTPVLADPPPPSVFPLPPNVFCFRITDVERPLSAYENDDPTRSLKAGAEGRFLFEFEVLNWTNQNAIGLQMAMNTGTSSGVSLTDAFVDKDGRGGTAGAASDFKFGEIDGQKKTDGSRLASSGHTDAIAHQSGRGNTDFDNTWRTLSQDGTMAVWDANVGIVANPFTLSSTAAGDFGSGLISQSSDSSGVKNQNLLTSPGGRIPGTGVDATGDTAIDGGPGCANGSPTSLADCGGAALTAGVPDAGAPYVPGGSDGFTKDSGGSVALVDGFAPTHGDGNVLDGFVIEVDGLDIDKTVSFNWNLLGSQLLFGGPSGGPAGTAAAAGDDCANLVSTLGLTGAMNTCFSTIGTAGIGNQFGFGTFTLSRVDPGPNPALPGPLFAGSTATVKQNAFNFFIDGNGTSVSQVPNPAGFASNPGAAQTAPFKVLGNNVFGQGINTQLASVPEPATLGLLGIGLLGWAGRRRKGWARF